MIGLTSQEREELKRWSSSRTLPAGDVFKAKLIVVLADGRSYSSVETELGRSRPTIARWKARFEEARIAGLSGRPASQSNAGRAGATAEGAPAEAGGRQHPLVLAEDGGDCGPESGYCTQDRGQDQTEAPSSGPLWRRTIPRLKKSADIIALYMDPPQHAAVFCVNESRLFRSWTGSILSCLFRQAAPSITATELCLSVCAALDVRTGEVPGKTARRNSRADFVVFLGEVVEKRLPTGDPYRAG
ncbi:MAG: endonuclease [Bryobacterales bacterium]|nr:endonuclease [Bryobacterales bacterium]